MDYAAIASCPLFAGLTPTEIDEALSGTAAHRAHYDRGEMVFRLGDKATTIGIVLSGSVGVHKIFPAGDQVRVTSMHAGSLLGQGAVFSQQGSYPCDVVAQKASELLLIERNSMLELLRSDERIMENLVRELATATYRLQWRIELLSHSGIKQKIAFYLLTHEGNAGKRSVRIPATISAWALELNVSRTSLHRELRGLADAGIIAVNPPQATILDARRLEAFL